MYYIRYIGKYYGFLPPNRMVKSGGQVPLDEVDEEVLDKLNKKEWEIIDDEEDNG